ncbi:MAG TPA: pilus assembly protein TadG-related protein [Terriglobales bacterium]|nr:pilus assembly protein TadG-related protein [Terriglobales bacterium]
MSYRRIFRKRTQERGQTIALVALAIVTLLAMAALAIDVVTLYVAKGEVQRAADAAALVAAKAFVDSGVTSDPANASLQTLAENMANAGITGILPQNKVAGAAPVLVGTPSFCFSCPAYPYPGNPQVAVTLQRTGLPIFFARIWKSAAPTVTASAKAEAYNPSNSQITTGNFIPITLKNIKPLLIANQDNLGNKFVIDTATGAVAPRETNKDITLTPGCQPGGGNPNVLCIDTSIGMTLGPGKFWPAAVDSNVAPSLCPSCQGSSDFEQSIECGRSQLKATASPYSCGGTATNAYVDMTMTRGNVRNQGHNGLQCLRHYPSNDTIDPASSFPNGPIQIIAGSGPFSGGLVSTSQSIATFPIIDSGPAVTLSASGDVKIIGYLQGFIESVTPGGSPLSLTVKILNISGCGNSPSGTSVQAGGTSAIPVRLISQ